MSEAETSSDDARTVDQALTDRAAELKALIDWARTRLERAAALVALATDPGDPSGRPSCLWQIADALSMADTLNEDVWNRLGENSENSHCSVPVHVSWALDREMEEMPGPEANRWNEDRVRRMTVAELAAALKEEPATAQA